MGIYDELGLDPNIDRNDFTAEHAARVFMKAAEGCKSGDAELVKKLMDTGFTILKIVALLA